MNHAKEIFTEPKRKGRALQCVSLDAVDSVLLGKYSDDAETVVVELDSSISYLVVQLPGVQSSIGKQFFFKNLGPNSVVVQTQNNEPIDYVETYQKTVASHEFWSIASNGKDKWISLQSN